ncbi:MAG: Ig-like domain-containing protein, partial [Anaerolineae bacterium]|nr:Ig-like domain-containing protein [Anaerolineae bacterium]
MASRGTFQKKLGLFVSVLALFILFLSLSFFSLGFVKAAVPQDFDSPPEVAGMALSGEHDIPSFSVLVRRFASVNAALPALARDHAPVSRRIAPASARHAFLPAIALNNPIHSTLVYSETFEGGADPAHWSDAQTYHFAVHTGWILGLFGEASGENDKTVTLSLDSLPPHDAIKISFQLVTIGSWDGIHETHGDAWDFSVQGGPLLLDTTFSVWDAYDSMDWWQNYPDARVPCPEPGCPGPSHPGHAGASHIYDMSEVVYDMAFTVGHTGNDIAFDFHSLLGEMDENWGIDNVEVSAITYKQKVLLVDDDEDSPDVRGYYTTTLDALGVSYAVWDTSGGEPAAGDLAPYDGVFWFTGGASGSEVGPSGAAEAALSAFLDDGGRLLISSQGYHESRGLTGFMTDKLGVSVVTDTAGYSFICGEGPVYDGICFSLDDSLFDYNGALMAPDATANAVFGVWNTANVCGVQKATPVYSATFFGFPLEAAYECSLGEALLQTLNDFAGEALYPGSFSWDYSSITVPAEEIPADGRHVASVIVTLRDDDNAPMPNRLVELLAMGTSSEIILTQRARTDEIGNARFYLTWTEGEDILLEFTDLASHAGYFDEDVVTFTDVPVDPDASTLTLPDEVVISECGESGEFEISAFLVTYAGAPYEGRVDLLFDENPEMSDWTENGYVTWTFFMDSPRVIDVSLLTYDGEELSTIVYAGHPLSIVPGSLYEITGVELSTYEVLADGEDTAVLTMTLLDDYGNRIPQRAVELYVEGGCDSCLVGTATSDEDGQVVFADALRWQPGFHSEWLGEGFPVGLSVRDTVYECAGFQYLGYSVNFLAGPVDLEASTAAVSPLSITIGSEQPLWITATLLTISGHPYSDQFDPWGRVRVLFNGTPAAGYGYTTDDGGYLDALVYIDWGTWHTPGLVTVALQTFANDSDPSVVVPVGVIELLPAPFDFNISQVENMDGWVTADGVATATLVATALDIFSNPIPGAPVQITATGAVTLIQPVTTTDAQGLVTATISSAVVHTSTVRAYEIGTGTYFENSLEVRFIPGPPSESQSIFEVFPRTVPADGVSTVALTLTLRDVLGHPVADRLVSLQVSGAHHSVRPAACLTTGPSGVVTFTVSATAADTKTLTFRDLDYSTVYDLGEVRFVPVPPDPDLSTLAVAPTLLAVDGTTPALITVTLRDANGNPLIGTEVALQADGTDVDVTQPALTNAFGRAWGSILTTHAQTVTVSALAAGSVLLTDQVAVRFTPGPLSLANSDLTVSTEPVVADGVDMAAVTVTLHDAFDNPIAGQSVSLSVTSGTQNWINGQSVAGAAWTPVGVTNASGVLTATWTSTVAEVKTLRARVPAGLLADASTATFVAGAPTQLFILLPGETLTPGLAPGKTGTPLQFIAGEEFTASALALDAYWNVAPLAHTALITGSDAAGVYPAPAALVDGARMFTITCRTAGSHTLFVSDLDAPALPPATSAPFAVVAGPATRMALDMPGIAQLAAPVDATVTAYDAFDNIATSYAGTVRFTSSDVQAELPGDYTFTSDSGAHTFVGGVQFRTSGEQWVRVTDVASPALVATATVALGGDVVIDADTTWDGGIYSMRNLTVTNGATLDLSSVITANAVYSDDYAVTMYAETIVVEAGAAISADGQGYGGQTGPGAGAHSGDKGAGGAGHGGVGGDGEGAAGGEAYGSVFEPVALGSGGGYCYNHVQEAGVGGGAIRLVVNDVLHVDGRLSANGADGAAVARGAGGGSGGSVWIQAATITGDGVIQANGGVGSGSQNRAGGGAGGRIALYYADAGAFVARDDALQAYGGDGHQTGGPGTVYLYDQLSGDDVLRIDNAAHDGRHAVLMPGEYSFDEIGLNRYGRLTVAGDTSVLTLTNGTLTGDGSAWLAAEGRVVAPANFDLQDITLLVEGDLVGVDSIAISNEGGLTLYAATPWRAGVYTFTEIEVGAGTMMTLKAHMNGAGDYENDYGLELRLDRLSIAEGGAVVADGQGYGGQTGPGAGARSYDDGAGGAGHGGMGGDGYGAAGGVLYGSIYEPVALGSGGGYCYESTQQAGVGGGAIHLVVNETLLVDGRLSANGTDGAPAYRGAGGGSGGSVWIQAATLTGDGAIQANGGDGSGSQRRAGGGAGGRIALYADVNTFSGALEVLGGSGYKDGENGTLYMNEVDPALSTLEVAPSAGILANGVDASVLTVTILGPQGQPVAGKEVEVRALPASAAVFIGGHPATGYVLLGATGADGVVTGKITATVAGARLLNARVTTGEVITQTATVIFTVGDVDRDVSLVESDKAMPWADGQDDATVTVTLLDVYGHRIPDKEVVIQATGGVTLTQAITTTNALGQVQATVRSAEVQTVTVTALDLSDGIALTRQVTLSFVAGPVSPAHSTVVIAPDTLVADGAHTATITATLMDALARPVTRFTATLSVGGSQNTIAPAEGVIPDSAGRAVFFLSSTEAELKPVSVLCEGVSVDGGQVFFASGPADPDESLLWASPTRVVADGVTTATVHVLAYDAEHNPVPGISVVLNATGTNVQMTAPAPTGVNGRTSAVVWNAQPEVVTFTATADGVLLNNT